MGRNKKRKIRDDERDGKECRVSEDVLFEILVRLPAQDVSRLMLVSKQWLDLISGNDFKRANLDHTKKSYMPQLIWCGQKDYYSFNMKTRSHKNLSLFSFVNKSVTVLDTLDGLVLFKLYFGRRVYICNPITRRVDYLLAMPADWKNESHQLKLMFDKELRKYVMIGFCYGMDNYCLVIIKGDKCKRRPGILKNSVTWMKLEAYSGFNKALIMDGVLHWIAKDKDRFYIQTMNVMKSSEIGERIEFPYKWSEDVPCRNCSLSAENIENCVSLILSPILDTRRRIQIWVLSKDSNDYNNKQRKWIKQYDIEVGGAWEYVGMGRIFHPFHVIRDNNREEKAMFIVINNQLFSYDANTSILTQMEVQCHNINSNYFPSLITWD